MTHPRLVSAGAGSGKTWRIVQEVVERVAAGLPLDRVAAVTFTEAAAGELRERLRAGLRIRGLHAEAADVERANVCTIHRFALTLLRRYPLPASLPPDPVVLEQNESRSLFTRSMLEVLREGDLTVEDGVASLVADLVEKARSLGMEADDLAAQAPGAVAAVVGAVAPAGDPGALDGALRCALDAAYSWLDAGAKERSTDDGIRRELQALRRAEPVYLLDAAERVLRSPAPSKTFLKEVPALIPAAHTLAARHPAAHDRLASLVEEAFRLAAASMRAYEGARRRLGALDFEEMQLRALRLLTGDGRDDRYARAVAAELPFVVVDEFQDSSPLQFRLFEVLRAAGAEVCYVGDLKQAIYGFRGADSSLFGALLTRAASEGPAPEVLDRSRRSRPELVRFANAVFSRALPAVGVPFDALTADNDYTRLARDGAAAVELLRAPPGSRSAPRIELGARRVRDLLASGVTVLDRATRTPRPVRPGDVAVLGRQRSHLVQWAGALRALGVAVQQESDGLFETLEVRLTRAWLAMLASPRDRAAAAMVLLSELYGLRQSTVAALSVAKLSGSPRRAAELAASDPARLALTPFERRALERCDADLRACREALRSLPLGEAVELALERVALIDRLALRRDPAGTAQLRANVGWVVAEAHALSARGDHTLSLGDATGATVENLLHHLQGRASERLRQPVAPGDDLDAVHLLTLHGAKGLEFPVVLVDLLHAELKVRAPRVDVVRPADTRALLGPDALRRFSLRCVPDTGLPPIDAALRDRLGDLDAELREALRLFYVGVTRARDHLLVTWPSGSASSTRFLLRDALARSLPEPPEGSAGGAHASWLGIPVTVFSAPEGCDAAVEPPAPLDLSPWRALVEDDSPGEGPAAPRLSAPQLARVTPTDLCMVADCPEVLTLSRVIHDEHLMARSEDVGVLRVGVPNAYASRMAVGRDEVAPSRVGELVHAAVSRAGLLAPSAYAAADEQLADAVLTQHGQAEHRASLTALIVDTLVSLRACVNLLRAVTEPAREIPFVLDLRGTTLHGIVDLVVRAPDGLHVIDLKTHPLRVQDLARWAGYYRPQLDAYAVALHRLSGMPVRGRHLAVPAAGMLLTLTDPFEPAAAYAELAGLADRIARRDRGPARDCNACGWKGRCAAGLRHLRAEAR